MIALYRRHVAGCKNKSRKQRNCRCPIWAEGTVHDEKVRRSLELSNWEAAVRLIREWEINKPSSTLTVPRNGGTDGPQVPARAPGGDDEPRGPAHG